MTAIRLEEPAAAVTGGWRPFGLGFRPFFLLAGLGGTVLMALWLWLWHAGRDPALYYGATGWHSHEMLFGYTMAVVGGFLLTAVRNWTGRPTPAGMPLALLALLWLAGRLAPWVPGLPNGVIAAVDTTFLPGLAIALAGPLWKGANKVNRVFLPLLLAMTAANGLVHADALGWFPGTATRGIRVMLDLVMLLLVFIGGRVIPFFTEKAVAAARPVRRQWVEASGFTLLLLAAAMDTAGGGGPFPGIVFSGLALVQAVRLAGWYDRGIWRTPLLWVLFTGYGWLVAGLLLTGLARFGLLSPSLATHAVTVGGIGVLTLGMMARVALGHTGRPLRSSTAVNLAFVAVNLAAAVRVAGPWAFPAWYGIWIDLAGLFWMVGFAIFAAAYLPILLRPRVDGRPD
jgi:uncharacterized protein involved in response to NO